MGQAPTRDAAISTVAAAFALCTMSLSFVSITSMSSRNMPTTPDVFEPGNVASLHAPVSAASSFASATGQGIFVAAISAAVAAAAAAAARSRVSRRGSAQVAVARQAAPSAGTDFSKELGMSLPLGFWDPLGLSKFDDPLLAETTFRRRRIVEIQHGRVSMLACIGFIVPEYFKFPGYLSPSQNLKFDDIPNGFAAISKVPGVGWTQILTFVGIIEVSNLQTKPSEYAGDYGYGAFGLPFAGKIQDKEKKEKSLLAEINNGRLAMMAIIGMFFQNGLTGSAWGDWALYTDSPLRSGKFSPGYNTLPGWKKPSNGFEGNIGDQAPLGLWDPLGFTKDGDIEQFKKRREVEIKHGRVSMFATIGYIVPEYVKLPGYLSPSMDLKFEDVPNGLGAISKVPAAGWAQIVAFIGFIELSYNKSTGEPGNYGKGFLGLGSVGFSSSVKNPDVRATKLAAELANGRLAMMAIIGMFFQDGLTGSAWGDWALYTASPLRAFEGETGVQPPVGYWDPLGLASSGNVADFARRREVELKHGRISMFATIGYITPEYYKFPGYLAPSSNLQFSDVPNGLAALSKVPAAGWLQIVTFAGLIEVNVYNESIDGQPGNYGAGFLGLRSVGIMTKPFEDPESRKKKLNAELANGRLAMMAIIGMFFQDGCTGSAWGDWALYTDSPLRAL